MDVFQKCKDFTRVSDAREAGYYLTTTVLACQYILCADLWGTV